MEGQMARLERDVEGLAVRLRTIENASSPYAQQMITEFRALQSKIAEWGEQGTPPTRRELRYMERELEKLHAQLDKKADAEDVDSLRQDATDNRRLVKAALISAAL